MTGVIILLLSTCIETKTVETKKNGAKNRMINSTKLNDENGLENINETLKVSLENNRE
jgi:hypothetical protein